MPSTILFCFSTFCYIFSGQKLKIESYEVEPENWTERWVSEVWSSSVQVPEENVRAMRAWIE